MTDVTANAPTDDDEDDADAPTTPCPDCHAPAPYRKIVGQNATILDPHRRADGEVCGPVRVEGIVRRPRSNKYPSGGICCPACGGADTDVIDSRPAGDSVRRRRRCAACGERVTTYERIEVIAAAHAAAREYVVRIDADGRASIAPRDDGGEESS